GVDDERPGHTGRRPRGEQRTVDGPDLIDAEEVLEVRGHGGESAPVEGDDDERGQDEEDERTAAGEGDEQVQDRTAAEVEHVVVLPPQGSPRSSTRRSDRPYCRSRADRRGRRPPRR